MDWDKYEWVGYLFVIVLFVVGCLLNSCKSVQTQERVNYHDSVILSYRYDTTHIIIQDTSRVEASVDSEKESKTEIVFGDGGGSWNSQTGQAENVKSVRQSSRERELQRLVVEQYEMIDEQLVTIDSLQTCVTDLKEELEEKQNTADIRPKASGWHWFLVWWFWASVLVLLVWAGVKAWKIYKRYWLHI